MDGLNAVDNPDVNASAVDGNAEPGPVTGTVPESGASAAPVTFETGSRDPGLLAALLDGADPNALFVPKAEVNPAVETGPQPDASAEPATKSPDEGELSGGEPRNDQILDQIPDKFKNSDGSLNTESLMKSYIGMEKVLGEQGNKLGQMSQLQTQLQQLEEVVQRVAAAKFEPVQKAEPEGTSAAIQGQQDQQQGQQQGQQQQKGLLDIENLPTEQKEKLLEEYYEDPLSFLSKTLSQQTKLIRESIVQSIAPAIAPVVEKYQADRELEMYNQQIAEFTAEGQHPDFHDLIPQMSEIVNKYGYESITKLPNPIEALYTMAKGMQPDASPLPTPEQLISNPEYRAKILSDPGIIAEIRKNYVQEVKNGSPPQVIGTQPGGTVPATASEKPRSVREASAIFSRHIRTNTS